MGFDYWFVYFAQQRLSLDEYMGLIRKRFSGEELEEFEAWLSDFDEADDKTEEAADKVWESVGGKDTLFSKVKPSGVQISHPEKAHYWFDSDRVRHLEVNRFGRFDDELLKDATIISELVGTGGESNSALEIKANLKNRPELDALLEASDSLMYFNPVWRGSIRDLCGYAEKNGAKAVVLKAFSNDDVIRSIAGLAIGYEWYTSAFMLEITYEGTQEEFFGGIEWNGTICKFSDLIQKHFDGDPFNYSLANHLGSLRSINSEIMDDLGLEYVVGRPLSDGYSTVRVQGATVKEFKRPNFQRIGKLIDGNPEFVREVVAMLCSARKSRNTCSFTRVKGSFSPSGLWTRGVTQTCTIPFGPAN